MTIEKMNTFSSHLHDLLAKKVADGHISASDRDLSKLHLMIVPVKDELRWVIFNKTVADQLTDDIVKEIEALWTEAQQ